VADGLSPGRGLVGVKNPRLVFLTPVLTTCIFESANAGQLWQMWAERTAAGQSIFSWVLVNVGLWLWLNFYNVKTPGERFAIWATRIGICFNMTVILTTVYFRYIVGRG
jgi:hypothetical protein